MSRGAWAGAVHPAVERSLADGGPVAGVRIPARGAADDLTAIPGIDDLCAGLAANGLVLELLLRPSQLPSVARLADRFPDLRIVLCHLGIGQDPIGAAWEADLAGLRGAPTSTRRSPASCRLRGTSRHAISRGASCALRSTSFGADRLLFGSDWPMSIRTGLDYARRPGRHRCRTRRVHCCGAGPDLRRDRPRGLRAPRGSAAAGRPARNHCHARHRRGAGGEGFTNDDFHGTRC